MNILFLYERPIIPHMGGVQRVTHILAKEMLRRGHDVVFLSTDYDYRTGNNENDANATIAKQYFLLSNNNKDIIRKEYYNILREEEIDIVINQKPHKDTDYLLSITSKDIKKISCIHIQPFNTLNYTEKIIKYSNKSNWKESLYLSFCSLFPWYYKKQNLVKEVARMKRVLNVTDYLCLLSEHFIPRFLEYMPDVDKQKLIAVNNPAIIENINPQKYIKEKIIIWVGRQENVSKNIPAFIDIWNILSRNNKDWRAIIVGDGRDMQYNKNYAKKKSVERLDFVGIQKDVTHYYNTASFLGLTSLSEGFPMVLIEAMSNGCVPFVYNTFESINDIIDDGKNGIIVKPFNKEEMARRIQEVIDNKDNYVAMQQNAIEKVKTFSIEKIVDKWEEIFKL